MQSGQNKYRDQKDLNTNKTGHIDDTYTVLTAPALRTVSEDETGLVTNRTTDIRITAQH